MPLADLKTPAFKPLKPIVISWDTWRKGLNTLLRETEVDPQEVVDATNLILVGSGLPTKRWGSAKYFTSGATGVTRMVGAFKDDNDNIQVLATTDWGFLVKKNGASYTTITGVSWASGYNVEAVELGQKVYLVSTQRELARYDFTTLLGFATLPAPTGLAVSNLSLATGNTQWAWRVSATSPVGETIASTEVSLATLPQTLNTPIRLQWTPVTPGAGATLTGYNIYRGQPGYEVWVAGTDANTTTFIDSGQYQTDQTRIAPLVDTTGGPKAKFIVRFQDRLILAGLPGQPTKVLISGRYPQQERFDYFAQGGYILVDPDSGEDITGIGIYYRTQTSEQTIVVFKEHSVWEVVLDVQTFGNYAVLVPTYRLLTQSQGASSHRSIIGVENDLFFANTWGLFILRYEPQMYNIINANEISSKIRTNWQALTYADFQNATAIYAQKKYVISFPISKTAYCFDRERLAFTGPWMFPFNVGDWDKYTDGTGQEHWMAASVTDNNVWDFNPGYGDDGGSIISTKFKSRKEDFKDWTLFKTVNEVFMHFANVTGNVQVNIYIEDRQGRVTSAKSFTVSGSVALGVTGMGTTNVGLEEFGLTEGTSLIVSGELQKKALMYKVARTLQVEVITTDNQGNYQLLGIKTIAIPQARDNNPTSWNV